MTALWISHVTVTDPETYARYSKAAGPVIAAHGGEFLVRGGPYAHIEGQERARHVVIRFKDMDSALACYHSAGYQAALEHAKGVSERDLVIVEEAAPVS